MSALLPENYTSDATDGYVFLAGSCAISYPEDTDDVTYTKLLSTSGSAMSALLPETALSYESSTT